MAINDYVNPLSNTSYINKDFQKIYPELLDYIKKVSYKWDPSISDESDPGVILIKMAAILADKNNYIADKGVLETFPQSVTQDSNARQLFEQLGYRMKWYRGATTEISLKWIGDSDPDTKVVYTIPQFSMVSDDERSIVYTLLSQVQLSSDGTTESCDAIQGVITQYDVNGETNITSAQLSNNRLYFSESNVAENGIFICNTGDLNYSDWSRVDNLSIEQLGNKVYKFGISKDSSSCYIEFPDDIEDLIGEGLTINYILTNGYDGNVAVGVLEQFYNEVTITDPTDVNSTITLNADTVKIANFSAVINGKNPEDIDSAYRNYKKTIGVFNTLVARRDYTNYINSLEKVSNCYVTDRNNDLQNSYYVISNQGNITKRVLTNDISDQRIVTYDKYGNRLTGIQPFIISQTSLTPEQIDQFELSAEEYLKFIESDEKVSPKIYFINTKIPTCMHYNFEEKTTIAQCDSFKVQCGQETVNGSIIRYISIVQNGVETRVFEVETDGSAIYHQTAVWHIVSYETSASDSDRWTLGDESYKANELIVQKMTAQFYENKKVSTMEFSEEPTVASDSVLSAFDLKLYATQYIDDVTTFSTYDKTFNLLNNFDGNFSGHISTVIENLTDATSGELSDVKCIQHDFKTLEKDKICFFKNKYPVITKIIPQYKLTDIQISDLTTNIVKALSSTFNAKEVEFGEEIPYELVYNTIMGADERIKAVVLDNIEYITYAIYFDSITNSLKEVAISDNFADAYICGKLENGIFVAENPKADVKNSSYLYLDNVSGISQDASSVTNIIYKYSATTGNYTIYSDKINDFRTEIYAKSVLNGNTQLLQPDNTYDYNLNQKCQLSTDNVYKVNTNFDARICKSSSVGMSADNVFPNQVTAATNRLELTFNKGALYPTNIVLPETVAIQISVGDEDIYVYGSSINYNTSASNKYLLQSDSDYFRDGYIILNYTSAAESSSQAIIQLNSNISAATIKAAFSFYTSTLNVDNAGMCELGANESIKFYAPSLLSTTTYTLVKYQYHLNNIQNVQLNVDKTKALYPIINTCNQNKFPTAHTKYCFVCVSSDTAKQKNSWNVYHTNISESTLIESSVDFNATSVYNSSLYLNYGVSGFNTYNILVGDTFEVTVDMEKGFIPKVILANTDYKLETGESVTFYWQDSEEDDTPYSYRRYEAGEILQANFPISSAKNTEDNDIGGNKYLTYYVGKHVTEKSGTLSSATSIIVYNKSQEVTYNYNSYIKSLISSDYNLSSSKQILERVVNTVVINETSNLCYWILNQTNANNKYELFSEGEMEYILQTGEYFIYTNKTMTQLIILGSGTKITRSSESSTATFAAWEVSPMAYDDLVDKGISCFEDTTWFKIPSVYEVNAIEMQYTMLNSGISLKMTPTNSDECLSILFDSDGYKVYENPVKASSELSLSNFKIEYKDASETAWTQLTNLSIGDTGWDAYSIYSLNMSNVNSQKLLGTHSIQYWLSDNTTDIASDTIIGRNYDPIYLLCNKDLNLIGGKDIYVIEVQSDGSYTYAKFYSFTDSTNTTDDDLVYYDDYLNINLINDTSSSKTIDKTFEFNIPQGTYILPLHNQNESGIEALRIYCNGEELTPINSYFYEYKDMGTYYLELNPTGSTKKLTIDIKATIAANSTKTITIQKPYKYDSSDFDEEIFNLIFEKVIELDYNNLYDYTYIVDTDELISNPLNADSFMDTNHIYNQFTICQLNTSTSDIYITNKIK